MRIKRNRIFTYRIEMRYAVFAIEARRGIVVNAAPVARWAVGMSLAYVLTWARKRGAKIDSWLNP